MEKDPTNQEPGAEDHSSMQALENMPSFEEHMANIKLSELNPKQKENIVKNVVRNDAQSRYRLEVSGNEHYAPEDQDRVLESEIAVEEANQKIIEELASDDGTALSMRDRMKERNKAVQNAIDTHIDTFRHNDSRYRAPGNSVPNPNPEPTPPPIETPPPTPEPQIPEKPTPPPEPEDQQPERPPKPLDANEHSADRVVKFEKPGEETAAERARLFKNGDF